VVALNSLKVPAPPAEGYGPYHFWTQTNLFAPEAGPRSLDPAVVARQGMTLAELAGLLVSRGLTVRRYHGDQLTLEQFRTLARRSLADPRDRLLVNYDRRALGQAGGGHISPLAAYDARSDQLLKTRTMIGLSGFITSREVPIGMWLVAPVPEADFCARACSTMRTQASSRLQNLRSFFTSARSALTRSCQPEKCPSDVRKSTDGR
jgi:hypothetical protein